MRLRTRYVAPEIARQYKDAALRRQRSGKRPSPKIGQHVSWEASKEPNKAA